MGELKFSRAKCASLQKDGEVSVLMLDIKAVEINKTHGVYKRNESEKGEYCVFKY
jgi:hypothetical protein